MGTTVHIFSGSKVIAEYVNGALAKEYVYAGSQLLTTVAADGTRTYHHPDHLSIRADSNADGAMTRSYGHYPFGETWYEEASPGQTLAPSQWKFTSYERDSESGLDQAIFRNYSSRLGRFGQADPLAGHLGNPQSLNRYSYVRNDPINRVDPLGLDTGSAWFDWWMNAANNTYRSGPELAAEFADIDLHALFGRDYYDLPGAYWDPILGDYYDHLFASAQRTEGGEHPTEAWLREMREIACDPAVIQGLNDAWGLQAAANRPGSSTEKNEAWTVIEKKGGVLSTQPPKLGTEDLSASIKPTADAVVLVHTHPERTAVPGPSPTDIRNTPKSTPMFVVSRYILFVINPVTKAVHELRSIFNNKDNWMYPCKKP